MLIKYRFSINSHYINPVWKDELQKDYELESQQRFYRAQVSGKIYLIRDDFDWIDSQASDTEFVFLIEKSNDGGQTWSSYWTGKFFKTDCRWDGDDRKVELKLYVKDSYNDVLAGLEKEYNLIKLAPARTELQIQKRPLIQLYIPGDSVVSCFLSGNSWEQDVAFEEDDTNKLINDYYFALASALQKCLITGSGTPDCAGEYVNEGVFNPNGGDGYTFTVYSKQNAYQLKYTITGVATPGGYPYKLELIRTSDSVVLFDTTGFTISEPPTNNEILLSAVVGSGATGTFTIFWTPLEVYMRYILDVETISGLNTYLLPSEDLVEYNRNYRRAIGYAIDQVSITNNSQVDPTEYGLTDDGNYFVEPYDSPGYQKYYPVARSTWGLSSIWFNFNLFDWIIEEQGRKTYVAKDTSLISDAIKVLLAEFAPGIDHDGTSEYSEFLYGDTNPITYNNFRVMITQKSNIIAGEYDRPAQKAPITLGSIFTMLRDTFQCYWYIEDNKLKIEHISWFKNGGTYSPSPNYTADLTTLTQRKNNKKWGFESSKWEFDKADMAERIQFKWMDDVTFGFEGYPIEINSKFVQEGKIDEINVGDFTTDVDYMLLNPLAINQDGFALFAAVFNEHNLLDSPYNFESSDWVKSSGVSVTPDVEQGPKVNTLADRVAPTIAGNWVALYQNKPVEIGNIYKQSYVIKYDGVRYVQLIGPAAVFGTYYINFDLQDGVITAVNQGTSLNLEYDMKFIGNGFYAIEVSCEALSTSSTNGRLELNFINTPTTGRGVNDGSFSGSVLIYRAQFNLADNFFDPGYALPFIQRSIEGADLRIQNGFLSWIYLHPNYWIHDLPAYDVTINDVSHPYVAGIKRGKKQKVKYPSVEDPNPIQLIKTYIGDGEIQKLSINLSSRMNEIQLKYDTE